MRSRCWIRSFRSAAGAVDSEDVRDVLGFIPNEILDRTLDFIAAGNSPELVETVAIVVDQGLSLQQYVRELIARMRDLLMMKLGLAGQGAGQRGREDGTGAGAPKHSSEQDLIRYFDLLLRLESDIKWTSQPRFHLEIGLVKLAKAAHMRDIEDVLRDLKQGPAGAFDVVQRVLRARRPDRRSPAQRGKPTSCGIRHRRPGRHAAVSGAEAVQVPASPFARCGRDCRTVRAGRRQCLNSAREEPLVRRFLEVFRGDIAQVKPPKGETQ